MPDKLLTLTHIRRIIGEQIYVDARFWTIEDVERHDNVYTIFFEEHRTIALYRDIKQHYGGAPYVRMTAIPGDSTRVFTLPVAINEMRDMVTFLDAIADRLNSFTDKWNGV